MKNRLMKLASFLLAAVVLTTCAISGTFAKYVTTGGSSDSARVAKWGVVITANGATFATSYDDTNDVKTVLSAEANLDVNVVAPGTSGELVEVTLTGTPEVAFHVDYTSTLTLNGWVDGEGNYYCPIVFVVNGAEFKGTGYRSAIEFQTAVTDAINAYSKDYAANQDLATESTVATPDVSWRWEFDSNDDVKDTALGNAAANGNAATILLAITTTITQID